MKTFLHVLLACFGILIILLVSISVLDYISDKKEWKRLAEMSDGTTARFDYAMVRDLPEPAQRFFHFAIAEGTPLLRVAEIDMGGHFSLGTKDNPNYQPMEAHQILASPFGFVWRLHLPGIMPISGSDSGTWTRFRILGFIPVARMGGDMDHTKAAFGRYAAESVFWTPAAVLPSQYVKWQAMNKNTARVTVTNGEISQEIDVQVNEIGRPVAVSFMRWSNANKEKTFRLQPFGGKLSDFREVQGYKVPFKVEAANMFSTNDEFVFFKAEVKEIRYLK